MAETKFTYDVFPEDLGSSYYGHFMTMTAMLGTGAISTPTTNPYPGNPLTQVLTTAKEIGRAHV